MIAPPPMPCSARAATSMTIEPDRPLRIDPTRKHRTAAWYTTLRPKMSPTFPTTAVTTVEASR